MILLLLASTPVAGKHSEDEPKCRCDGDLKLLANHDSKVPVVDLLKTHGELLPHQDDLRPVVTERG